MPDIAYDGTFDIPISFTFTPTTGTAFGSAQAQVEEATPPETTIDTSKFTPISGSNAGLQQMALGIVPVKQYKIKWTYIFSAYQAAMTCLNAKVKGQLVVTYGDGHSETYLNTALVGVEPGAVTATNLRTGMLTFEGPSTPTIA